MNTEDNNVSCTRGKIAEGLFSLSQKAKSKGGDKYKGELSPVDSADSSFPIEVYVPQLISRRKELKEPLGEFFLCVCSANDDFDASSNSILMKLTKPAKGSGGDKYEGTLLEDKMTIYIPQQFSRLDKSNIRDKIILAFMRADSDNTVVTGVKREVDPSDGRKDIVNHHKVDEPTLGEIAYGSFFLHAAAKSKGGDRYKGMLLLRGQFFSSNTAEFPLDIYIPQKLSRRTDDTSPIPELQLSVTERSLITSNSVKLHLTKAAKANGGDKYEGEVSEEKLMIYLPQEISRVNDATPRDFIDITITPSSSSHCEPSRKKIKSDDDLATEPMYDELYV